ncbi:MAG: response regulator [Anaerolineae bacterium]|nr:response regulator [Anaerolineae bacterium]
MADKVRVLIVDDVSETRENVRKLLQFETDIEVVGTARSGKEAVQLTFDIKPDVVLMDINMPDMDGITATEAIRQRDQVAQIVILSVQGDPNYMRRAMLAGARDFLTKPPMADELISAIRRAGQMAHSTRAKNVQVEASPVASAINPKASFSGLSDGKVIVVYSPKGGAGTTTLAVNLSVTLHNDETRVILIDAKLQYGDVAVFLNEQGKNTILDLTSRADELDAEVVESVVIKHAASGMRVLAAPARPEQAEQVSSDQFVKLVKYLRQNYAYVVIDTSSALEDVTLAALDNADIVILVVTQDIPAIKNCRLFLDLMDTIGTPRERICFVMNKYDKRISITPEKVGDNLKQLVVGVIPLDERVVIPSVNRGVPFMIDNKSQPSSKAIFSLAEVVRKQIEKTAQ